MSQFKTASNNFFLESTHVAQFTSANLTLRQGRFLITKNKLNSPSAPQHGKHGGGKKRYKELESG